MPNMADTHQDRLEVAKMVKFRKGNTGLKDARSLTIIKKFIRRIKKKPAKRNDCDTSGQPK